MNTLGGRKVCMFYLIECSNGNILKSRRKLNLQFQNLVFTRGYGISSIILGIRRVSFISLPKKRREPLILLSPWRRVKNLRDFR